MHSAKDNYTIALLTNDFTKVNEVGFMAIEMGCVINNALSQYPCTISEEEEVANNALLVYPNPGNDLLIVKGSQNEAFEVEVSNLQGQLLLRGNSLEGEASISTQDLPSGTYLVRIVQEGESYSHRWIKH